jgi:uncharacterized DUF497 family protein
MSLQFEWDAAKARTNIRKHKVSFEEAKTVFNDPELITYLDTTHSDAELRFVNIGQSERGRVLIVIHTERDERTRIISSRKATAAERAMYDQGI